MNFLKSFQLKESIRTGEQIKSQQGERLYPQTVYAHIRGLGHPEGRITNIFLSHRGLFPQSGYRALNLMGLAHNAIEDRPLS